MSAFQIGSANICHLSQSAKFFGKLCIIFSLPQQTTYPEGNESKEPGNHERGDYGNQRPFPTAALAANDGSSRYTWNI
jgi:hypothetical protein